MMLIMEQRQVVGGEDLEVYILCIVEDQLYSANVWMSYLI